jgi:hypothetical protein
MLFLDLRAIWREPRVGTHFSIFSSRKKSLRHRHSPDVATALQEGQETSQDAEGATTGSMHSTTFPTKKETAAAEALARRRGRYFRASQPQAYQQACSGKRTDEKTLELKDEITKKLVAQQLAGFAKFIERVKA